MNLDVRQPSDAFPHCIYLIGRQSAAPPGKARRRRPTTLDFSSSGNRRGMSRCDGSNRVSVTDKVPSIPSTSHAHSPISLSHTPTCLFPRRQFLEPQRQPQILSYSRHYQYRRKAQNDEREISLRLTRLPAGPHRRSAAWQNARPHLPSARDAFSPVLVLTPNVTKARCSRVCERRAMDAMPCHARDQIPRMACAFVIGLIKCLNRTIQ